MKITEDQYKKFIELSDEEVVKATGGLNLLGVDVNPQTIQAWLDSGNTYLVAMVIGTGKQEIPDFVNLLKKEYQDAGITIPDFVQRRLG